MATKITYWPTQMGQEGQGYNETVSDRLADHLIALGIASKTHSQSQWPTVVAD